MRRGHAVGPCLLRLAFALSVAAVALPTNGAGFPAARKGASTSVGSVQKDTEAGRTSSTQHLRLSFTNWGQSRSGGQQRKRRPLRNERLHIVIANYDLSNLREVVYVWQQVLGLPQIVALKPYVFFYCQNPRADERQLRSILAPILIRGEVVLLDNKGREGRVYLHHIVSHYDQLAQYTLFSQDIRTHLQDTGEQRDLALGRLKALFQPPRTGVLALSLALNETCDDSKWKDSAWQATPLMYETYAMAVSKYCPPKGFVAFYKGQFIVSQRRLLAKPARLYEEMLQMLEAPSSHWVHEHHANPELKTAVDPFLGHVFERAWSLLFDCHDPATGFVRRCKACDAGGWRGCPEDACQCLDAAEEVPREPSVLDRIRSWRDALSGGGGT